MHVANEQRTRWFYRCGECAEWDVTSISQGVKLGPEEYAEFLQKKWFRKDNGDSPGYHGECNQCGCASSQSHTAMTAMTHSKR